MFKRNLFISLFWILLLFRFSACGNNPDNIKSKVDKIEADIVGDKFEIPLNFMAEKQKVENRHWKEIDINYQFAIGGIDDTALYSPTIIKTDYRGMIYVLDPQDCCVKKFDSNGKLLKKIGKRGKGPGEFLGAFRMDVSPEGRLVVFDSDQLKCEIFDEDKSQLIKTNNYSGYAVSFTSINDFCFLQLYNPSNESNIVKYNISNGKVLEYEEIIQTQEIKDHQLTSLPFLEGEIYSYDKGKLVYVPMYMNCFITFAENGKIAKAYKTIDNIELPSFKQENPNEVRFNIPVENMSAYDSSVLGEKLIIISYKGSKENHSIVADFYSLSTGKYTYSVKLDISKFSFLHFTNNRIYCATDKAEVKVYNYKIL